MSPTNQTIEEQVARLWELTEAGGLDEVLGRARWIWGAVPRQVNEFRLFRHEFEIESPPVEACLCAFAESRYKLYLNGRFVQCGPTPCQPEWRLIDRHDVASFLKPGQNCLAFEVHCPGVMNGQWTLTNPGLIAQLTTDDKAVAASDASWRTTMSRAWRHPTQVSGYSGDFQEWVAPGEIPAGWTEVGFDDGDWEAAVEQRFFANGALSELRESYVGYATLVEHPVLTFLGASLAEGVVTDEMRSLAAEHYTGGRNRWLRIMGKWNMRTNLDPLEDEPMPEPVSFLAAGETRLPPPPDMVRRPEGGAALPVEIVAPDEGHPALLFDLGTVRDGMWELELESDSGGVVDIARGGRLDGERLGGKWKPYVDRVDLAAGEASWQGFFARGSRYIELILRGFRGRVVVRRLSMRETLTPVRVPEPAVFESDDEDLNKIWRAAAQTVRLYMNGCGFGDPIRERHKWHHDDQMALRMAFNCFGEWRAWRRALELTGQNQRADGSIECCSPGYNNDYNMLAGSNFWVAQVAEYVGHTGDVDFGREMLPRIERHTRFQLRSADGDGLIFEPPGRRFLGWIDERPREPYAPGEIWRSKRGGPSWSDWFQPVTRGYNAILNAYWLWGLTATVELCARLGDTRLGEQAEALRASVADAFEKRFWSPDDSLYRDNVAFDRDGHPSAPTFCEDTHFTLMRAGLMDAARGLACVERFRDPAFRCRRATGMNLSWLPPFLLENGRTGEALATYLDVWGEPVRHGWTTLGEEFSSESGSLCHIHGATPARDFLEYLAGIRLRAPGWSEVLLAPPAADPALPDLRAEVPAPGRGRIRVEIAKQADGSFLYRYEAPAGIRLFLSDGQRARPLEEQSGSISLRQT